MLLKDGIMLKMMCALISISAFIGCGKKKDDEAAATCLTAAQTSFKDVGCSKSGCHNSDGTITGNTNLTAFMSTQALYNASDVIACINKVSPCNANMLGNMTNLTLTAAQSKTFTDCK